MDGSISDSVKAAPRPMFQVRPIEQWQRAARKMRMPKKLFGEIWYEGELCMMIGDSGSGKSILGMQIAESITSGRPVEPLKMTAEPQSVVYVDFEMSAKQLDMRYSGDQAEGQKGRKKPYQFPKNSIFRAEFDPLGDLPKGCTRFEDGIYEHLRDAVVETGAKVVIIEDITFLRRANGHVEPMLVLLRRLRRLKAEFGISILVIMTAHSRREGRPLEIGNLGIIRVLSRLADSVFGIGQGRIDGEPRYIKELMHRNYPITYGEGNVPAFVIERREGNFLSFGSDKFWHESHFLINQQSRAVIERAVKVQRLSADNMTQRQIAEQMEISLGSVNRYLHMQLPPHLVPRPTPEPAAADAEPEYDKTIWNQTPDEDYPGQHTDWAMIRMGYRPVHRPDLYGHPPRGSDADTDMDMLPETVNAEPENTGDTEELIPPELRGLKRIKEDFGAMIFVEKEDDEGNMTVWFRMDRKGNIWRFKRELGNVSSFVYASSDKKPPIPKSFTAW